MANPSFEIFRGADRQYYFVLRATGDEIVLTSEAYDTMETCKKGIRNVRFCSPPDASYYRMRSSGGRSYFTLVNLEGETIATSEQFETTHQMETSIILARSLAPVAPVEDLTE